ncbi:MAG: NAD(P)/FAD-dependent oxidoreductase [Chloroflexi bacterium]|nr:NAD(P)/FAD-dependent oxidoreductase [Chloroflexota bacterium]
MTVGIVGAGVLGITLGYALAKAGVRVEVFEADPTIGGLAATQVLADGTVVDRFYHTVLRSDRRVRALCAELGLDGRLAFCETGTGLYHEGHTYALNTVAELLRLPPLGWLDRVRLGLTVVVAQLLRDWQRLESIPVEDWLARLSGRRTVDVIWRAMLRAKFDGAFDDVPATYIWARLVRTSSARGGAAQKEGAGYLPGGYLALLEAMARRIEEAGGRVHVGSPVDKIVIDGHKVRGLGVAGEVHPFDAVVTAVALPLVRRLLPDASPEYADLLAETDYLDIICPLLVLDRPLTEFWTLNISDEGVPFTGIIETTSYIDPTWVGGHHLVYLPKYVVPGGRWQALSDAEIVAEWLRHLEVMFPAFRREWIREVRVQRAAHVEPLHRLNGLSAIPPVRTPYEGLYLATTAQIYPQLTNVESVTRHAGQVAQTVLADLGTTTVHAALRDALPAGRGASPG